MKRFKVYHIIVVVALISLPMFVFRYYSKINRNLNIINQRINTYSEIVNYMEGRSAFYEKQIKFYKSIAEDRNSSRIPSQFELDADKKIRLYELQENRNKTELQYYSMLVNKYETAKKHPYLDISPDPPAPSDP